ncbi:MAG: VOC family protein [Candidatus Omnitrophica bacterium]|nr:VOC family protein [Candidatus Omnitrophota bacterium]
MALKQNISLDLFGPGVIFHHVGIATLCGDDVCPEAKAVEEPGQKVKVRFADMHGIKVEIIEPLTADSPIKKFLKKYQYFYHLCFLVDDMDRAIKIAEQKNFRCVAEPVPSHAFEGKLIAWLYSPTYGLIEFAAQ